MLLRRHARERHEEVEVEEPKELGSVFPKSSGGGWYELSNGEKVQGKEEAEEREVNLREVVVKEVEEEITEEGD